MCTAALLSYQDRTALLPFTSGPIRDHLGKTKYECMTFFFFLLFLQAAYSLVPTELHGVLDKLITTSKSSLFQLRTVKELLWGYNDPLFKSQLGLFFPVSKPILHL